MNQIAMPEALDRSLCCPSARVECLRNQCLEEANTKKEVWGKKLTILNEETRGEPLIIRKAMACKKVLCEMPIEIKQGELIVGRMPMASVGKWAPFPDYATEEEKKAAAKKSTSPFSVWGHHLGNYPKFLREGIAGFRKKASSKLTELERAGRDPDKQNFYRAVLVCFDGTKVLSQRYVNLALELAEKEHDSTRREELQRIADICKQVPENPPRNFHEALQACWFMHLAIQSFMNWSPLGRFDQYMFPFLQRDLEKGDLSLEQAQELVDCLWIKFNGRLQSRELQEDVKDPYILSLGGEGISADLDKEALSQTWQQNIVLGGQDSQGKDVTNTLTYLCLNATQKLRMIDPIITVRLFKDSPPQLLRKSCELLQEGHGQPTINNDEVIIPALQGLGVPLEEARDYSNDGCWEPLIPGKSEFRYSLVHALCCLERALNRGYSRITGKKEGVETKNPYTFVSFEEIMEAFKFQLDYEIRKQIDNTVRFYGSLYDIAPVPFMSSTIDNCLDEGKDITQGGAKYVFHAMMLTGLSHVADSLAAIKRLVFDDKMIDLSELLRALECNFSNREDIRQILITRAPKYGNDSDYVDELAREVLDYFTQRTRLYDRERGHKKIRFSTAVGTFEFYVFAGKHVGATPDGRLSGAPIGANLSPSYGMTTQGPGAAVNSFAKLNLVDLPSGSPLDLGLPREMVEGEAGLENLVAFVRSFLDKGGNMLTINVNSVDKLREAQKNPNEHRDILVRVAGYQAYFVSLEREHQDVLIARIEQYGNKN
jgi:formate C-acetyltransferase